jgi:hypothetical protein
MLRMCCVASVSHWQAVCCRFSPQRVSCLCKGEIDLAAIEQQAVAAGSAAVPAWESFAVVPETEEGPDKRQRLV